MIHNQYQPEQSSASKTLAISKPSYLTISVPINEEIGYHSLGVSSALLMNEVRTLLGDETFEN